MSQLYKMCTFSASFQVLGVSEEPGRVFDELHEVHHQFALSPLPFHRGFCFVGNAAVRGEVSPPL